MNAFEVSCTQLAECASAQRETHTQAVVGAAEWRHLCSANIRNGTEAFSSIKLLYGKIHSLTQRALWCSAIIFSGRLLATTMESGNVSSNALFATAKHSVRLLQLGLKIEKAQKWLTAQSVECDKTSIISDNFCTVNIKCSLLIAHIFNKCGDRFCLWQKNCQFWTPTAFANWETI